MEKLYSKKNLIALILPLIFEQILNVTVGMADTIMVSSVGEAAVSGVSLVDSINVLLINLFLSLATGGAVIAARSLGQGSKEKACKSADQLLLSITFLSIIIMIATLIFNPFILKGIFGNVEEAVMKNASVYFYITALSFPFLAIMSASSSLCRAMGNSKTPMFTSILVNIVNVIGNAIFIMGLGFDASGVAIATLIARIVGAVILLFVLMDQKKELHFHKHLKLGYNKRIIKDILRIGVPTGVDNCIFQVGKILVQSLIASFGTASMAANAVGGAVAGFAVIPANAVGVSFLTIISQLIGKKQYEDIKYYIKLLMKYSFFAMAFVNIILILCAKPIASAYHLSPDALKLATQVIIYHSAFAIVLWPFSFALPNVLRAASDAKYTMMVSIFSMWTFRIALCYVLGRYLEMGLIGVWIAMFVDWTFRAICFIKRVISGKWLKHAMIDL